MGLSRRDNLRIRRLIESEWYCSRFGDAFRSLNDNWVPLNLSMIGRGLDYARQSMAPLRANRPICRFATIPLNPKISQKHRLPTA
jgi:hypothetical protein